MFLFLSIAMRVHIEFDCAIVVNCPDNTLKIGIEPDISKEAFAGVRHEHFLNIYQFFLP